MESGGRVGGKGELLRERWRSMDGMHQVVDFYGHNANMGDWAVFSNFYEQSSWPGGFEFQVPLALCACELDEQSRRVACALSEMAVMLCKAAAMGDAATYREIAQASTPEAAKSLGRQVRDFSDQVWARVECSVAFQAVAQKFMQSPELQELLR